MTVQQNDPTELLEVFDAHARLGEWDALVPVPLYHRRRRERGFNQAREIAAGMGATVHVVDRRNCWLARFFKPTQQLYRSRAPML